METPSQFPPVQRGGMIFHIIVILVAGSLSGLSLYYALQQPATGSFLFLLMAAILLFLPLPLLVYRAYALMRAVYIIERDGLRLHWGLRTEDIPLPEIEWIRPVEGTDIRLPIIHWPGSILGTRQVEGLGQVEFLASNVKNLLLVATPRRIFAISPQDTRAFLRTFTRTTEMGSLTPLAAHSDIAATFLRQAWSDWFVRIFIMASLLLNLALFIAVSLLISTRTTTALGFEGSGLPRSPGPSEHLLLYPLLSGFTFVFDLLGGMFFYRLNRYRPIAYILWIGGVLTTIALIIAVLFLV
jgi:hypothetical protein